MKSRIVVLVALALLAGTAAEQLRRPNMLNRRGEMGNGLGLLNRRGDGGGLLNRRMGGGAQQAQEPVQEMTRDDLKSVPRGTNGVPALAFNQAPIDLVLEAYAAEIEKTIIPAPDLPKATITLRSLEGQTLTKAEYLEAIEVVLTMNGVVLEPRGEKFLRALPRKTVRTHGIPLRLDDKGNLPEQGRVVSQMIQFRNIEVAEAQKALEGFKAPEGLFQVFERTNAILVTDTQENINRMLEVVRAIDIATPVTEDVFVRQIEFAVSTDIKTHLEEIVKASQEESKPKQSGPKQSGAPGFSSSTPSPLRTGLLNLNNRPGLQKPPENTPNANLVAAVSDADRGMIRGKVLILADERSNKLIIITNKANMDFFDKVIKTLDVETTPEVQIDVIRLKYAEAEDVEQMLNDLIGASSSSGQNKNNQNANTQKGGAANSNLTRGTTAQTRRPGSSNSPTFQNANASRLGELNKDNVKVLADKRINGIVVMARKADMRSIKDVIENMDVKLSQVRIETVIIEITLGDDLKTGIDWVQRGRAKETESQVLRNAKGQEMRYLQRTITRKDGSKSTTILGDIVPEGYSKTTAASTDDDGNVISDAIEDVASTVPVMHNVTSLVRDGFVNNNNYMLGGGAGSSSTMLRNLVGAATAIGTNEGVVAANPIGGGITYLLKSDKLNLAAVINASKTDSRAKYIASPIVMTVDNKEATIDATENRQFLTGWTSVSGSYAGSSMPSPNYSSKDIGIKIKVTPKINPNGTVMLTVEEEYSRFLMDGQQMLIPTGNTYEKGNVDLAVERKMSADVRLENMQTVVFGGLTETSVAESESGIPILKDIPWIGKWLFGSVTQSESRKELLVFMTPYVLDDEEAAQLEAMRRKKALSDPNPWDDHGWSASPLADPVSKKEQLRRFEDEWKKQDEERRTKLAIEKAKVERAKKLEKMSKEEREFWIKLHKDELEKEEKEAFEKKVEEQENLQEFVETLKKKDLEKAEKELKKADKESLSDNEYNKFIKDRQREGKPLPAGETLKKDAEALKESKKPETPAETPAPAAQEVPASQPAAPEAPAASEAPAPAASGSMLGDLAPVKN